MEKYCRRLLLASNITDPTQLLREANFNDSHIFVDDKHKLLVSAKPSVAALFWRLLNSVFDHPPLSHELSNLEMLKAMNVTLIKDYRQNHRLRIIHTHMKILIVQHPFAHIASLFEHINENARKRGQAPVSFHELIGFINNKKRSDLLELQPTQKLSKVCYLPYHAVIKLETFVDDLVPVFKLVVPELSSKVIKLNLRTQIDQEEELSRDIGKQVQLYSDYDALELEQIKQLLLAYKDDMRMFGYTLNATMNGMLTSCQYAYSDQMCC